MEKVAQETEKSIVNAIKINEKEVGDHLNRLVRQSVEGTINNLWTRWRMPYAMQAATSIVRTVWTPARVRTNGS